MKSLFPIILLLFCLSSYGQAKTNWDNTFIYGVKLPIEFDTMSNISIHIFYKKKLLTTSNKYVNGKSIKNSFTYLNKQTNVVNNLKLPFILQAKIYYWLLNSNMLTEMVTNPSRYKMVVKCNNKEISSNYILPETFDCVPDNVLNVAYLKTLKTRNKLLNEKIWTLNISKK